MTYRIDTPDFIKGSRLLEAAFQFAMEAHARVEQTRKYTGEPYIVHPVAVAEIVANSGGDQKMVAAALLHDTVEDTDVVYEDLVENFGRDVAMLVWWLTDVSKPEDGNRDTRKAIDREHISHAPASAQTVKVADLIDNTKSIVEHDENFAKVYIREKDLLLEVLTKANEDLRNYAINQVQVYQEQILQEALR